jgi:Cdc6-like AAA superfamily ATPase
MQFASGLDFGDLERELKALAQAAGMWQDEGVRLAVELAARRQDSTRIESLVRIFRKHLMIDDSNHHPFLPDPEPGEVDFGDLFLGTVTTGGGVRMPVADMLFNIFITAPPGRGKTVLVTQILTQLIERGLSVQVFDTQSEYAHLLCPVFGPDLLDYLDARACRINPFDPPETMSAYEWVMGPMCNYLRESLYWHDRTIELFRTICMNLFERGAKSITAADFAGAYTDVPDYKKRLPEFGSLERFVTMLKTVETFRCLHGERIEKVAQRSRIYDMRFLAMDTRLFLVSHLVTQHVLSRKYQPNQALRLVLVFDELNQFFTKETLRRYKDIGESFYLEMLRTGRKFAIGIVLADQVYSLTHEVAKSNCQNKVCLDIRDGPSRRELGRDLGLTKDQEDFLAALSYQQDQRRAVVQLHGYPYPFLMKVPHYQMPRPLTEEELQARCRGAVASMEWEPNPEKKMPTPRPQQENFLEHKELQILGVIACHHFLSQKEYAGNLGMAESTFSKWAQKLKQAGFLEEYPINLYNQGAPIKILFPSKLGYNYLDTIKVAYVPIPGNGSIPHRFWQHRIWQKVRKKGDLGGIEYELNGKRADVAVIRPEEKIAYEVVMTGPLEKEISNLRKDLEAGFGRVVFCVEGEEVGERLTGLISRTAAECAGCADTALLKEFT